MKKNYLFCLVPFLVCLISCDNTNKAIQRETMTKDVEEMKQIIKSKDTDSIRIRILDNMASVSKDLDFYKEWEKKQNKGEITLEEYLVDQGVFKRRADDFFNTIKEKKYTYKQLLAEIDETIKIRDKYYKEMEPTYKEIDSICLFFQKKIDERIANSTVLEDSLNDIIELKLVSIQQTEIGYRDVIAVRIQMINKTDQRIEALSFEIELTDKLGNKVATLNCKTNDGFLTSDIGLWTFGKYDRNDTYEKLENVNASHVTIKQRIKKVNINGQLIGADGAENLDLGKYFDYVMNLEYKTPGGKLYGYCPYLAKDNPYNEKVKKIEGKQKEEINNGNFPILKLWDNFSVYDFDKK